MCNVRTVLLFYSQGLLTTSVSLVMFHTTNDESSRPVGERKRPCDIIETNKEKQFPKSPRGLCQLFRFR